jgi:thioredoxin reductase (NADPH)
MSTVPCEITPDHVKLKPLDGSKPLEVPADFVLLMVGYVADMSLYDEAGVELKGENQAPVFNEETMETNVSGIFVAGTAVGGTQKSFKVFIENCHVHVDRIFAALTGAPPPSDRRMPVLPES